MADNSTGIPALDNALDNTFQNQPIQNQQVSQQNQTTQQSIDPNKLAALSALIQVAQQNQQPAMTLSDNSVGNSQGQPLSSQSNQSTQLNPMHQAMIDGATAGLKKSAQEAASTGGLPAAQHIFDLVNQAVASRQGTPIGTNQVQNPNILSPQNAFQNTAYNPQTGQIQEGGWVNRGLRGLSEGGIGGLLGGLLGPGLGPQMGATKQAQVLKAGQPAEIAKPQAEATNQLATAAQTQQSIAGQTPFQKGDQQKLLAEAGMKGVELTNESITALGTAFDKVAQTLNPIERAGLMVGVVPERLKGITNSLTGAASQQKKAFASRASTASTLNLPKSGDVVDGFKFKGGDPSKQSNWEKE